MASVFKDETANSNIFLKYDYLEINILDNKSDNVFVSSHRVSVICHETKT
jgi:hypothetical protein